MQRKLLLFFFWGGGGRGREIETHVYCCLILFSSECDIVWYQTWSLLPWQALKASGLCAISINVAVLLQSDVMSVAEYFFVQNLSVENGNIWFTIKKKNPHKKQQLLTHCFVFEKKSFVVTDICPACWIPLFQSRSVDCKKNKWNIWIQSSPHGKNSVDIWIQSVPHSENIERVTFWVIER